MGKREYSDADIEDMIEFLKSAGWTVHRLTEQQQRGLAIFMLEHNSLGFKLWRLGRRLWRMLRRREVSA